MSYLNGDRVEHPTRPLVIAVGNRFRGDDGVAGAVLDALAAMAGVPDRADLMELDGEPTRLVDAWEARLRVAVVDAVRAPDRLPGELVVLSGSEALDPVSVARWSCGVSGHSAGLAEALRLASVMQRLPAELCVVGVVAASIEHGTELTKPVAAAVPGAVAAVIELLGLSVVTERGGAGHVSV
jgi:hydrogenase maturation protease